MWILLDIPQRNDPSVNMPTAEANTRRVPKQSAIQPLMGIKMATVNVYLASTDFMLSRATLSRRYIWEFDWELAYGMQFDRVGRCWPRNRLAPERRR
jgi:hypothetical protein